jgi:hypothetical protein
MTGLELAYVRSIITKSMSRDEVADALSLIVIVDTVTGVGAQILFQSLYSTLVATKDSKITSLFILAISFVLLTIVCHMYIYIFFVI